MADQSASAVRTYWQTSLAAPSQWAGELRDGRMFYVRVRHGRLEVRISPGSTANVRDAVSSPAALLVALEDPGESFMDESAMKDSTGRVLDFAAANRVDAEPLS